jgi:hypothetical protein
MSDELAIPGREAAVTIVTESATRQPETDAQKAKREADTATLAQMVADWKLANAGLAHFRENAVLDAKFRAGTWGKKTFQWEDKIRILRESQGRPCLTINRAPGFIHQVTNQEREAHLAITVKAVDDDGDPDTAEVLQGIIRNIETNSIAEWQYARVGDKQAEQGLGLIRLVTEYVDEDGTESDGADIFKQCIKIKGERDPLTVLIDPTYEEPDASDAQFAFKWADYDRAGFTLATGHEPPDEAQVIAFKADHGDEAEDFFPGSRIRVLEYFRREFRGARVHKALLSTGAVIPYPTDEQKAAIEKLGDKIIRDRYVQERVTVQRKVTGLTILEETIWPDRAQPWTPVPGDELIVNGERDYRGVIRDSKDAAIVYNVEVSALVEGVGRGMKAPVVGYRGQFGKEGTPQRKAWDNAHITPIPFLEIEPMDLDGKPAGHPQPITFEPPLQGVILAIRQADEDYKSTAGFHDASLGERGAQESGIAIDKRQQQDQLGSSHYLDNFRMALACVGRRLIRLIRVVYDVPQVLRITGRDDREKRVMVYSGAHNDPRQEQFLTKHPGPHPITLAGGQTVIMPGQPIPFALPKGVAGIYDIGVGRYDVEVMSGKNSGTRRDEEVQLMAEIFKGLPPEYVVNFTDLWFLLMDHPVGRQLSERAKALLPKQFQDNAEGGEEQLPPQAAAKMAQMQQQLELAGQAVQQMTSEIKSERAKIQSQMLMKQEEIQSRERVEALKVKRDLLMQQIDLKAEAAMALLQGEIDRIELLVKAGHDQDMATMDAAFTRLETVQANMHDLNLVAVDQAHEDATTAAAQQHEKALAAAQLTTDVTQSAADRASASADAERARQHDAAQADKGRQHDAGMAKLQADLAPDPAEAGASDGGAE